MSEKIGQFPISENAKIRSAFFANLAGVFLFSLITYGVGSSLYKLAVVLGRCQGQNIAVFVLVIGLLALLWVTCAWAMIVGLIRRRKMFRTISGFISIKDDFLQIGTRQLPRNVINTITKTSGCIRISFCSDGEKMELNLPLSWIPPVA